MLDITTTENGTLPREEFWVRVRRAIGVYDWFERCDALPYRVQRPNRGLYVLWLRDLDGRFQETSHLPDRAAVRWAISIVENMPKENRKRLIERSQQTARWSPTEYQF